LSLNNFIPTLWSDTILSALQKNLVYGRLFNIDYEGEIKAYGDTVKINAIGDITISNYTKDTAISSPQSLTDAQTQLSINNAKYYNFAIDDVDQMQAHPQVMAEALRWAGYKMADTMDQYYAGFYVDAVGANLIGSSGSPVTPVVGTAANAGNGTTVYDYLVQLGQLLTQSLTPKIGRWCVVPPWVSTLLTQDVRFTGFGTQQSRATIPSTDFDPVNNDGGGDAYLGKIRGMDVYESVNAPHLSGTVGAQNSVDVVYAGHSMAVTKAEGLVKTEAYRPPDRFSDAVKGLCLYGAKTVRPYAVAAAYLNHP
jgi:hypothetical protein